MRTLFKEVAMGLLVISLGAGCVAWRPAGGGAAGGDVDGALYERVRRAAVEVLVEGRLTGSGWFADAEGWAVTADHVIGAPGRKVELLTTVGRLEAEVVAVDRGHDLALLRVPRREGGYPALPLASRAPGVGATGYIYGAPIFRHDVLLPGTVARGETTFEWLGDLRRYFEIVHYAAMTPKGVSGGPWVNRRGEVVGLQSAMMQSGGAQVGVAFVAPQPALARLLRTRRSAATPTLGAAFEELWEQPVEAIRRYAPTTGGLVVKFLAPDGPLARAGVKKNELILAVDDRAVQYRDRLLRAVRSKKPGDQLELTILQPDGAKIRMATVTLDCLEQEWLD